MALRIARLLPLAAAPALLWAAACHTAGGGSDADAPGDGPGTEDIGTPGEESGIVDAGDAAEAGDLPEAAEAGDEAATADEGAAEDAPVEDTAPFACDAMTDLDCMDVQRGESHYFRRLSAFETIEYDDEGTTRTVVPLALLIDAEVTDRPEEWRYQIYGTDGFTFGGYATWTNMENGYIEIGTRKVVWDPSQELPRSYRVRDAYLILLTPAGG
jgi:hypothetical protein